VTFPAIPQPLDPPAMPRGLASHCADKCARLMSSRAWSGRIAGVDPLAGDEWEVALLREHHDYPEYPEF